jgi:hypothetical protein
MLIGVSMICIMVILDTTGSRHAQPLAMAVK